MPPKSKYPREWRPDENITLRAGLESLVNELDEIRQNIGVDRGALIKVWLHERVLQEKAAKKVGCLVVVAFMGASSITVSAIHLMP